MISIKYAIVTVYDKSYLNLLADYFIENKIVVLSTGGTASFLKNYSNDIKVIEISKFTKFDEILDGRVKSLHPYIHSGILAKKKDSNHQKELKRINIPFIDLVVVNLYPFEKTINDSNSKRESCIENIDIGGATLIRGAAKNYENVTVLTNPNQYKSFLDHATNNKNFISKNYREDCAKIAFENTANYEVLISNWFNKNNTKFCNQKFNLSFNKITELRYGENPHQDATLFEFGKRKFLKLSGKDLSYNNICDLEVAIELACIFSKPSCVIVKHANPCGVALDLKQNKAYAKALKCDKISAFGGIVAFNKKLSLKTAEEINKLFTEIVIAPDFSSESRKLLSLKKNLILIKYNPIDKKKSLHIKTTKNFLLLQNRDNKVVASKDLKIKTEKKPNSKNIEDMIFAFIVSKFLNSNAIVLAENQATIGIGVGQTNRLDAARQAIRRMRSNFKGSKPVMASDGFFPFSDIIKLCSKNKINGIIQPGGSKNDKDVIKAANKHNITMAFTGIRHFKH